MTPDIVERLRDQATLLDYATFVKDSVDKRRLMNARKMLNDAADEIDRLCRAPPVAAEMTAFLLGEGPLDGVWFGDPHPTEKGAFWWRKHLRPAPPKAKTDD